MRAPPSNELMLAWEAGLAQSPARRALGLLASACDDGADVLAALPVGARDARLFRLRRALFGPAIAALAQCPACGERLDVGFDIDDVCPPALADGPGATDQLALHVCGYDIAYRVPTSADLLSLGSGDAASAAAVLLARCVSTVRQGGALVATGQLPQEAVAAIAAGMAAADPLARIELALACPACGHGWDDLLDIGAFLWKEVDAWARRTLHDVHTLARAYGWCEADILAMTPYRRGIYLDMVRL